MKNSQKIAFVIAFIVSIVSAGILLTFRDKSVVPQSDFVTKSSNNFEDVKISVSDQKTSQANKEQILETYGKLPLVFEPNVGQTDERVKYVSRGQGYSLFLTDTGAVFSLQKKEKTKSKSASKSAVVQMEIAGANPEAKTSGVEPTAAKSNYFVGNDQAKWQTDVAHFQKVKYESIYNGVDLVYYGNQRQLEYDFVVQPEADPNQIKINFNGVAGASVDKKTGDLLLETELGIVRQHAPIVYQEINDERKLIASSYSIANNKEQKANGKFSVSFELAKYDKSKALVIDPILVYSSYLGGTQVDGGNSIAVDAEGNAYIVGTTTSLNFPTTAGTIKPALLPTTNGPQIWSDAFVTKVNPTGTAIVFSTYFGGRNNSETGNGVAVDNAGNVFVSGMTNSNDFPTVNAYRATSGGIEEGFAAKLNSTGSAIIFSTYLGGETTDYGGKVAVIAATGESIFTGTTYSANFPTTPGVLKPATCQAPPCGFYTPPDGYIAKFAPNGAAQFVTLFGGGNSEFLNDVALDSSNNIYVVGQTQSGNFPVTPGAFQTTYTGGIEGFIGKINPTGTAIVYASFIGGGLQSDRANGVAVDSQGNAYIAGQTENAAFPTTEGAFDRTYNGGEDAFVSKVNPTGSALVYSTFLGGGGRDKAFAIAVGENDNAFVAGEGGGASFPRRNSINGANGTIFLSRLNANASELVFSTLLGTGGAYDLALDASNNAYLTGQTNNIVTTPGVFQPNKSNYPQLETMADGFVAKIGPADENATVYSISGTINDPNQTNDYTPVIVTLTGTVNRSYMIPYGSGNGIVSYHFGNLPAGGNYTVTAHKIGYLTDPENVVFNNLQANQFADFTIQPNQAPVSEIISPQHGATFDAPATITIQATASDPDNHPIAKVDFVAYSSELGNIPLGTDTTAPYEFTWTNVPTGVYALYAIPTDSLGLRGISMSVVHVEVLNPTTPTVTLTSPANQSSYVQGDNIPLAANVSSSITVLEFYEGNNLIGRRTAAPWASTWRPLETGTYSVYAKGFTSTGQSVTSGAVSVAVAPINHRISGRVIDNISASPVSDITIRLTSSTNPAINAVATTNAIGEYLFTNLNTTPNDSVTLTPISNGYTFEPGTRNINYLGYVHWEYQVFTATAQTGMTVNLTSPTEGQIFTAPATVNIAANVTATGSPITKVDFYQSSTYAGQQVLIGTDTTAPYEIPWTNVPAGTYYVSARATNANGAVATSERPRITVNQQPASVRIHGVVNDPFGNPRQGIVIKLTGSATQTAITNNFGTYIFTNLPGGGNYTVMPEAPNTTFTPPSASFVNLTQDSLDNNFTASSANQAPTVQFNSPVNGAIFNMPVALPINVSASDPDGQVVHLAVTATVGAFTYTIGESNNGTFSAPWQVPEPGDYTLTARVRDNGGRQVFTQINITVNQPAPVNISGRIVDRSSAGIAGVRLELKDYPDEQAVVAAVTTDADGNYTIPNVTTFRNYILRPSKLNYTFAPRQRILLNVNANQSAGFTGTLALQRGDFDGDGETELGVWRPSNGVWYVLQSGNNSMMSVQFGSSNYGDILAPGNYDGDQKNDIAVFRPSSGAWYILNSSNGQFRSVQFGANGDKPVPGDYDGDGKTDIAVFRPEGGFWYFLRSSDGQFAAMQWGSNNDIPIAEDFDGDGITDVAVFRPSDGNWYIRQSSNGTMRAVQFGASGDVPVGGDFDGDKKADIAVFRAGAWYILKSSDNSFKAFYWGTATDKPLAGDYDKDGKTDFAVFRPSEGNWYIFRSSTNSYTTEHFGSNGDIPIPLAGLR